MTLGTVADVPTLSIDIGIANPDRKSIMKDLFKLLADANSLPQSACKNTPKRPGYCICCGSRLHVVLHHAWLVMAGARTDTAVRMPRSISTGGGGQPGTTTSTGSTFNTPPHEA